MYLTREIYVTPVCSDIPQVLSFFRSILTQESTCVQYMRSRISMNCRLLYSLLVKSSL